MSKGIIYCAHCIISGKKYIGKTINSLEKRKSSHLYKSKQDGNGRFQNAIKKYGWNNFVWGIIEECEIDVLSERESYWINFYESHLFGYNLTLGGDGGFNLSQLKKFTIKSPSGEIYNSSNVAEFSRNHNLNPSCLCNVINGKRKSHKGWTLPETKLYGYQMRNEKIIKEFKILSPDGIIYSGKNIKKFAKENGLNPANLSMMINGKYKSHKGWTLYK